MTPWTVAYQALPSMKFSRQEYWSGLPFPSPGDLPDPWIEPRSPALQADALPSEPPGKPHMLCSTAKKKKKKSLKAQQRVLNEHKIHLMNEVLSEYQLCSERNVNLGVSYSTRLAAVMGKLLTTQTFVLLLKS